MPNVLFGTCFLPNTTLENDRPHLANEFIPRKALRTFVNDLQGFYSMFRDSIGV